MEKVILVVDQEAEVRAIITSMLVSAGYACLEATNGLEALAVLDSGKEVDLVTSELMMTELDGIGLLEQVKQRYPRIPFVMLTAVDDKEVADETMRRGARDYLLKPFERDQLISIVDRELGVSRPRPDLTSQVLTKVSGPELVRPAQEGPDFSTGTVLFALLLNKSAIGVYTSYQKAEEALEIFLRDAKPVSREFAIKPFKLDGPAMIYQPY